MSKKHVEEYYAKMFSDYTEMKSVLDELQKDENISVDNNIIEEIKSKVKLLEANYKRLSYIMFLLNMPNKKSKKQGYLKRESKKLSTIPVNDRKDAVIEENKEVLQGLKSIV